MRKVSEQNLDWFLFLWTLTLEREVNNTSFQVTMTPTVAFCSVANGEAVELFTDGANYLKDCVVPDS